MTNKEHMQLMIEGFEEAQDGIERVIISATAIGLIETVYACKSQKRDFKNSIDALTNHIKNGEMK